MLFGRIVTAAMALALASSAPGARAGDGFVLGRGEDELRNSADEPAIASAHAGPESTAGFHSSPGDGLAHTAIRGAAQSAPGSRAGALFRSILVPGYGQFYNGQRVKGGFFLGTEIALLSSALAFHVAGDSYLNTYNQQARAQMANDPMGRVRRLHEAAQARYQLRDCLLLAATGMWVVNMADAYLSGGRRRPLEVAAGAASGREVALLAAIRPGQAILGMEGRF